MTGAREPRRGPAPGERAKLSAEDVQRILDDPRTMIQYSRCMWCGRRTPHEWCHQCSERVMKGGRPWTTWHRFAREPEQCEGDAGCPVHQRLEEWLARR